MSSSETAVYETIHLVVQASGWRRETFRYRCSIATNTNRVFKSSYKSHRFDGSSLNTLLNAVLLDSVEQDVQRIQRINQLVDGSKNNANLKKIPTLDFTKSNIGEIARERSHKLPRMLRLTISAFGDLSEASEILSYLMFESDFCKKLIEMGYEDSLRLKKKSFSSLQNLNSNT